MTLEMPRKRLRFVKLPSVVGATNAAVLSEHAQPDMHLLSDSEDTGSMSGDDSSENEQPATSSASEQKIKYDNLPDGEDQQYFVAHCSSKSAKSAKSATPAAKKNRRARKEERFATRRYTEQRERPSYGAGIAD